MKFLKYFIIACVCLLPVHFANAATTDIIVNASGDASNDCTSPSSCVDVYAEFSLYVNGVKVGATQTLTSSSQNYTFSSVTIPTSGTIDVDVFYNNDVDCDWEVPPELTSCTGDRNVYLNTVKIGSVSINATDALIDRGETYTDASNGIDTLAYEWGLWWAGSIRTNTVFSSCCSTLIAEYHLDENSWNGTTAELKDTAGFIGGPFNGTSGGSPIATATDYTNAPAITGSSGTCGYASLTGSSTGGSNFSLNGLPVDTSTGKDTTVSFWMYWDGSSYVQPIGWHTYNLFIGDGLFGFNTGGWDNYATSSSGLVNGWHHVVAVFHNGNVANSKMYIDGIQKTLSQSGSPTTSGAYVTSSLQLSGWGENTLFRLSGGRIDEVKIYDGAITQSQVTADFTATHSCGGRLIAEYHMDETSWDGTIGEVGDTAGYTGGPFDGQGIGSPIASANFSNPAIAGTTGTCGYATLSGPRSGGSAFMLDNLPVSTDSGDKTSVSFWLYWDDDSDYVMPIGWHYYDIYIADGFIGFSTSNSDIYGTDSAGLANGWHHIVAVFTNNDATSNKLYIDGSNVALTQKMGTPGTSPAVVQSRLQTGGWNGTSNYRLVGRLDELKVYNGEVTPAQVTADYTAIHSCPTYVTNVDANGFNCIAEQASDVAAGHLYTQLAGTAFNIKVAALKSDNTVETSFSEASAKSVTLQFLDQNNANSPITFNDGANVTSKIITFPSGDTTGMVQVNSLAIANAYKNLTCQITDANQTPSKVATASDSFSVRPTQLTVTSTANADSSGTLTTATPIIKAGVNFTMSAASGVIGYDGTPIIDTSKLVKHSGAFQIGTLSGSLNTPDTATGVTAGTSFTYSEVGYFKVSAEGVYDSAFTAVDSANGDCIDDFSNTAVAGKYGCKFTHAADTDYFGRFIPDHFQIGNVDNTTSTVAGCEINPYSPEAFTYYGYDGIVTTFSINAVNANNEKTKNYRNDFARLSPTSWTDDSAAAGFRFTATNIPTGANLLASATSPTGSWSSGRASIEAKHYISRLTTPMDPLEIDIQVDPIDADLVTTIDGNPVSVTSQDKRHFKYGRLKVANAYGSEKLPLKIPVVAQYWTGDVYRTNVDDECTNIATANVTLSNYKKNLNIGETTLSGSGSVSLGKINLQLSEPGEGNNGSVDLSFSLSTMPWFGTSAPTARAVFGVNKTPFIYMREVY
jgi:hypothetical protein